MNIVTIQVENRFLLRPGANDHKILDALLSPGLLEQPVKLDGILLEAPHRKRFIEARKKLDKSASVMVEPQAYRLQHQSVADHPRLQTLDYAEDREIKWEEFRDESRLRGFVTSVLDAQSELDPTHFIAPAFYVEDLESPWAFVNSKLVRETLGQVNSRVYATVCGSYSGLCKDPESRRSVIESVPEGVEGVFVLVSPFSAYTATPSKLRNYLKLLEGLRDRGLVVYASRQPAFGLGCMSLGIAGFDAGIGGAETFDFKRLVRRPKETKGQSSRQGRRKSFYAEELFTHLPSALVSDSASNSLAGLTGCTRWCCRFSHKNGVLLRNREHFVRTRVDEVSALRRLPIEMRSAEFRDRILRAKRLADRVLRSVPELKSSRFGHLDAWDKCFTDALIPPGTHEVRA